MIKLTLANFSKFLYLNSKIKKINSKNNCQPYSNSKKYNYSKLNNNMKNNSLIQMENINLLYKFYNKYYKLIKKIQFKIPLNSNNNYYINSSNNNKNNTKIHNILIIH